MAKEKTLNQMSLLAFAFVAIVVTVNLFTTNNYGRANRQVVEALVQESNMFDYHQLRSFADGSLTGYVLIDLRHPEEFAEGHLPTAINIPYNELLNRSSLRKLNRLKDRKPVLYGSSESQAHTARVLLLAKGLENEILVMGGNYDTAMKYAIDSFEPGFARYKEEKARFDYPRFMGTASPKERSSQPAGIIPAVQTQTLGAQGGC